MYVRDHARSKLAGPFPHLYTKLAPPYLVVQVLPRPRLEQIFDYQAPELPLPSLLFLQTLAFA